MAMKNRLKPESNFKLLFYDLLLAPYVCFHILVKWLSGHLLEKWLPIRLTMGFLSIST